MMMLSGANNGKFWKLRKDLSNDCVKGRDNYPSTVDGMLRMINTYKVPKQQRQPNLQENEDRLVFVQQGNALKCWHCDENPSLKLLKKESRT